VLPDVADDEVDFGGGFAPELIDIGIESIFGKLWTRPGLSRRDRSLVTLGILIALRASDELKAQADYLRSNTVDSAIGKITWDAKGDIKDFKFVFYNFDDKGTPVLVK